MLYNEDNEYIYKDIELTPEIISKILYKIYINNLDIQSIKSIRNTVAGFHELNGGIYQTSKIIAQTKKGMQNINKKYLDNINPGNWRFKFDDNISFNDFYTPEKKDKKSTYDPADLTVSFTGSINMKDGWVYFYYFPSYKKLAEINNEEHYPIKIGKSVNNPKFRVNEQSGTALPEKPVIFIQVKTLNCSKLESLLHSFFILKGRKKNDSVGDEWFYSNENEIVEILILLEENNIPIEYQLESEQG